jgi:hypothetical protein
MIKLLVKLIAIFSSNLLCAQHMSSPICGTVFDNTQKSVNPTIDIGTKKIVRINIHFILHSNGTGNMTEFNDDLGNPYSGYDLARDFINEANNRMRWNEPMRLPPGNNTPVLPKNVTYALDAVYFHRNSSWFNLYPSHPPSAIRNMDSVCNIFIYGTNIDQGAAWNTNPYSQTKIVVTGNLYTGKYKDWRLKLGTPNQYSFSDVLHGSCHLINHEMGHLLGLDHTVKYYNGSNCPIGSNVDSSCNDACGDTPSAWYITDTLLLGGHPGCGWNINHQYCSNNVMDYGGQNALTPCQINTIHNSLNGGMKRYSVCTAVMNDKTYCSLIQNKLSYYGQNLSMGCNTSSHNEIGADGNRYLDLYFSSKVEFYGSWDVKQKQTLDIYHLSSCP